MSWKIGLDFTHDFDYNSIRVIFGRMGLMDKLIAQNQVEKYGIEHNNTIASIVKCCKGIVKARETTKQRMSDNCTTLIKDINIPVDIRMGLVNMRNRYHIRQDVLVFCGMCSITLLSAYAIKCFYKYSLKERDNYVK